MIKLTITEGTWNGLTLTFPTQIEADRAVESLESTLGVTYTIEQIKK
jgi:hypothetical protein